MKFINVNYFPSLTIACELAEASRIIKLGSCQCTAKKKTRIKMMAFY